MGNTGSYHSSDGSTSTLQLSNAARARKPTRANVAKNTCEDTVARTLTWASTTSTHPGFWAGLYSPCQSHIFIAIFSCTSWMRPRAGMPGHITPPSTAGTYPKANRGCSQLCSRVVVVGMPRTQRNRDPHQSARSLSEPPSHRRCSCKNTGSDLPEQNIHTPSLTLPQLLSHTGAEQQ